MSTITTKTLRSVRRHRNSAAALSTASPSTTPEPPSSSSSSSDTERTERPAVRSMRRGCSFERAERAAAERPTTSTNRPTIMSAAHPERRHHENSRSSRNTPAPTTTSSPPVFVDVPSGGRLNPAARTPTLATVSIMEAERRMRSLQTLRASSSSSAAYTTSVGPNSSRRLPAAATTTMTTTTANHHHQSPAASFTAQLTTTTTTTATSILQQQRRPTSFRPREPIRFVERRGITFQVAVDSDSDTELEPMPGPLHPQRMGFCDPWRWSRAHRSHEVVISGPSSCTAFFHPNWSKGTAGVRGTKMLNNGRHYWEVHLTNRIFGTSMMFGIGTDRTRLHADNFTNLLGMDEHSWGLSHKGVIWHKGAGIRYTKCFKENLATTIGVLFDGIDGTLTYYKDGICLGVAFCELDQVQKPLYPIVASTAAKTEMVLGAMRREFVSLQDRCRAEICKRVRDARDLERLEMQTNMPPLIVRYLADAVNQFENL